jgi:hypothetical protein
MRTITRTQYEAKRRHEYAGPASGLLPAVRRTWPGTHWLLSLEPEGTCLVPVRIHPIG